MDSAAASQAAAAVPGIPRDDAGPVFREPWEAQAFAMALALHERGLFSWTEWAATLADQIKRAQAAGDPDTGETYYRHWLATLEHLVAAKGVATTETLHRYRDAWDHAADRTPHGMPIELHAGGFRPLGLRRIFAPALGTQRAGRAFAAAITPIVLRAALAEITGVGVLADQVDQPCPAELMRQLPGGALSSHISGVCSSKFFAMPRLSADCSALMVSSRQSG